MCAGTNAEERPMLTRLLVSVIYYKPLLTITNDKLRLRLMPLISRYRMVVQLAGRFTRGHHKGTPQIQCTHGSF